MIVTSTARTAQLGADANNPFVAWDNLARLATLSGNLTAPDGSRANAITGTTYDFWRPSVGGTTATFVLQFPTARTISTVVIAAHNLATVGGSVAVQRSTDGTTWVDGGCGVVTPTDDGALCLRMVTTGADAAYWRLLFSSLPFGFTFCVGVIYVGGELVIPRRIYSGFAPPIVPTEVQLQSNVSVGGNLLGSQVVASGSTLETSLPYLEPSFVRGAFRPFMDHFNRGKPFAFAWRPAQWSGDVWWCWRDGDVIRPVNEGGLDFMSVSMAMRAYDG